MHGFYCARYNGESFIDCFVPDESSDGGDKTEWEQQREREEFAQAARLYRPIAGMMASRFTRAQHDDDDEVVRPTEQEVSTVKSIQYHSLFK